MLNNILVFLIATGIFALAIYLLNRFLLPVIVTVICDLHDYFGAKRMIFKFLKNLSNSDIKESYTFYGLNDESPFNAMTLKMQKRTVFELGSRLAALATVFGNIKNVEISDDNVRVRF